MTPLQINNTDREKATFIIKKLIFSAKRVTLLLTGSSYTHAILISRYGLSTFFNAFYCILIYYPKGLNPKCKTPDHLYDLYEMYWQNAQKQLL